MTAGKGKLASNAKIKQEPSYRVKVVPGFKGKARFIKDPETCKRMGFTA